MRLLFLCAVAFLNVLSLCAEETATVRAADGFQLPVGVNGTGTGYYIARGYKPNGHLGEDWNGVGGGDTDLGDPVYATAHGIVVFARNYHVGWGNVVILRHAYYEGSELKYVDSLYGHLLEFTVKEGEQVHRGQQIGKIGNNFGMYEAHLHFEMRKNLQIGMYRSSFLRDFSNYYTPNEFVAAHHICPKGNHMVSCPINTFAPVAPPILVGPHVETPVFGVPPPGAPSRFAKVAPLPQPASPVVLTSTATPAFRIAKIPAPATTPAAKTPSAESPVVVTLATPEPTAKHGKLVAITATPDPTPKKGAKSREVAAAPTTPVPATPAVQFAETETVAVYTPPTPSPSGRHSKKTAAAVPPEPSTPEPTPKKILTFQPIATPTPTEPAKSPEPAVTEPSAIADAPPSTPSRKHGKHLAATATPGATPKKNAKTPVVAAAPADPVAPVAAPPPESTAELADTIANGALPLMPSKKGDDSIALIPEAIGSASATSAAAAAAVAAAAMSAAPTVIRRTRRPSSSTPSPDSKFANQTIPPEPILPTPTSDGVPMRPVGSSFKVDPYGDLRGKGF